MSPSGPKTAHETPTSCDLQLALTLADQLRASGQWPIVVEYYRWAGAAFVRRGEPHHAFAVYSLLSQLLPHCLHTHAMLAEQLRQLGEIGRAAAIYERIAHTHQAHGRLIEAAQVYRIVVDLVPTDIPRRIALAELALHLGQVDEAFKQFETASLQLRQAHRIGEFLWVAQRMLALKPNDHSALLELAQVRLAGGDLAGAVHHLRQLLALVPKHDRGRELMAYAYAYQGQVEVACRCVQVLAEEYRHRGVSHLPEAKRLVMVGLGWNPQDGALRSLAGQLERASSMQATSRRGANARGEIRARPNTAPAMPSEDEDTKVRRAPGRSRPASRPLMPRPARSVVGHPRITH